MLKSCDIAEIDHNMMTLQHESLSLTISADGRCHEAGQLLRQSLTNDSIDVVEIIIDANQLHGGSISTILGENSSYLPSSIEFTLDHFEPRPDGTCLLRYKRCN